MDVPSEMEERVARAIWNEPLGYMDEVSGWAHPRIIRMASAVIEAIKAGKFVEYRVTSPDGELFAETAGTPAAAYAEAQHYAMQEPGAVIEQVVCLPALSPLPSPSLKEQERT